MATKEKCPACGGTEVTTIRYQGELYYQCVTMRPRKNDATSLAPCKFWSTKWRPIEKGVSDGR